MATTRLGSVGYFLYSDPSGVARYDFTQEKFLPPITLPSLTPATAFAVDGDGIYAAFGQNLARYDLDGSNKTHLTSTESDIQSVLLDGDTAYISDHSGSAYVRFTSLDKTSGQIKDTRQYYYGIGGVSFSATEQKIIGRRSAYSFHDISVIPISGDGELGAQTDSPYHDAYPKASQTYVFPDQTQVVDNAGIVYNTSDLTYVRSLGTAFDDITFNNGLPVLLRGNRIDAYSDAMLKIGEYAISDYDPIKLFASNSTIFAFYLDDDNAIAVDKIAEADITLAQPEAPVSPIGLAYSPDEALVGVGNIVYLLSRQNKAIFRWSLDTEAYIDTIPLREAPTHMAYSAHTNRLYLSYESKEINQIKLDDGFDEEPFAISPMAPVGLATANEFIFVVDNSGAWVTHFTYAPDGDLISQEDWNFYSEEYIWSPVNQKMYFFQDGFSPNDLHWEDISDTGEIGDEEESPYHGTYVFEHPIRVSPDGGTVLTGTGVLFDALNLNYSSTLSNNVIDAAWRNNALFTLRDVSGSAELQAWSGDVELLETTSLQGESYALLSWNDGASLVAITQLDGKPEFALF